MADPDEPLRRFGVRSRISHERHVVLIEDVSLEAAAIAYLEGAQAPAEEELHVVVRDLATGVEHCFRIDLASGETQPCD